MKEKKRKAEEDQRKLRQNSHFLHPSSIDNLLNYLEDVEDNDTEDEEEEEVDDQENFAFEIEAHEGQACNVKIDN